MYSILILLISFITLKAAVMQDAFANNGEDGEYSVKWTFSVSDDVLVSSPVVAPDSTIYVGGDNYFYALNPDGALKWRYRTFLYVGEYTPAVAQDGSVYFTNFSDYFYALNPDGTVKWFKYGPDKYVESPAIGYDGTVYIGCRDGFLYAFHPDGSIVWQHRFDAEKAPHYCNYTLSSVTVGKEGTIYVACRDSSLYAVNPWGTRKWKYKFEDGNIAAPSIDSDGTLYVNTPYLYALNPDGTLKWKTEKVNAWDNSPAISADGTIYVTKCNRTGELFAFRRDGTLKWSFLADESIHSSPAIGSDGTVFFGSYNRALYALNPDGSLKWEYNPGRGSNSSPVIMNGGTLYICGGGVLYAFRTDTHGYQPGAPWPCFMLNNTRCAAASLPETPELHTVAGWVYDNNGEPVPSVEVSVPEGLTTFTNCEGRYELHLPDGVYNLRFVKDFVIQYEFSDITVNGNEIELQPQVLPRYRVRGRLHIDGEPLARVMIISRQDTTVTNSDGRFSFDMLRGEYTLEFDLNYTYFPRTHSFSVVDSDVDLGNLHVNNLQWGMRHDDIRFKGSPAVDTYGRIVIAGKDGEAYCFSLDGTLTGLISPELEDPSSMFQPSIGNDDAVYLPCMDSVQAFDRNGGTAWLYAVAEGNVRYSPAVDRNGNLYFTSDNKLYSVMPDGSPRWSAITNSESVGPPTIGADGTVYVACKNRILFAFDPFGKPLWEFNRRQSFNYSPVAGSDGTLYCACLSNHLYALDHDGNVKWLYKTPGYINETLVIDADGVLYFADSAKYVYAINPDGTLKWLHREESQEVKERSMIIGEHGEILAWLVNSGLLVFSPDGAVSRYEPKSNSEAACTLTTDGKMILFLFSFWHQEYHYTTLVTIQTDIHGYQKDAPWPCYRGNNSRTGLVNAQIPLAVDDRDHTEGHDLPDVFSVRQNYPNPFNPITVIEFFTPHPTNVRLSVYDISGRKAAVLAEDTFASGVHRIEFDGSGYGSGIYLYRLETPECTVTRKMLLLK